MKSNISFLTVLLALLMTSSVYAQRGNRNANPEDQAKKQTTEMTEALSLSGKQAEKVGEINLKYANKMKESRQKMRAEGGGDWSAMRETMKTLRTEQNAELKNILTNSQFEKWETLLEERRKEREQRRGERGEKGKGKKPPKETQG